MRGKAHPFSLHFTSRRITPAYAGKSSNLSRLNRQPGDHPRLCGEKFSVQRHDVDIMGSPPPMRGKVIRNQHSPHVPEDHPRLCGEKDTLFRFSVTF